MLTIELQRRQAQTPFNLRRWSQLLADEELRKIEGRIETDRHGHIIMSPPPAPSHGSLQLEIGHLLREFMPRGRTLTECPISTVDGVKAADVAWVSKQHLRELGNRACFEQAPEICVEVLSPGNTEAERGEKAALYFDSGAQDVWLCAVSGKMRFFVPGRARPLKTSPLCPGFPRHVRLS